MSPPTHEDELDAAIARDWDRHRDDWLHLLQRLVDLNTHSDNLAGIDRERGLIRPAFEQLGFTVSEPAPRLAEAPRERAAHLVARRPIDGAPTVLLIGHLDTVFPPGVGPAGLSRDGDLLRGPGVGDIKGGVVTILAALQALRATGREDELDVTVFLNSDEEVGSHTSRDLLRELAADARCALGFEPGFHRADESVSDHRTLQHVVARKGCGRFEFVLDGVAAHAGGAHERGASAIEALARKVVDVHALTCHERGVTTNVGLVEGGRAVNTVAPNARGAIDFRFRDDEDGTEVATAIREVLLRRELVNPAAGLAVDCRLEPGSGVLWPTLRPTPESIRLSELVIDVTQALGWQAEAIARGGASDAAHAAAAGVPSICGLGPVTDAIHTDAEHTSASALGRAVRVAAAVFARLPGWS